MWFRTLLVVLAAAATSGAAAQTLADEPVEVRCPSVLGVGIVTQVPFCDVEVQRDPALGILVVLPRRGGEATLSFNLHNRHAYSGQAVRSGDAYAQYVASIAVATMEGEVIARGAVLSEFRSAADLVDRIAGGAGPLGIRAIAPLGSERVFVNRAGRTRPGVHRRPEPGSRARRQPRHVPLRREADCGPERRPDLVSATLSSLSAVYL